MTHFAIAGIQTHVSALHSNLSHMEERLNLAMQRFSWIDMVAFSELAPFGPLIDNHPEDMEPTLNTFREWARKYRIWLIPGSFFERRNGKVYNTTVVINPDGDFVGRYDKLFPFMPYESGVEPGTGFLVFDVPDVGRFGLSICYDLWFPETSRTLTSMGVEVIIHPVLTGTTDREAELTMAQATAAQFQCYVVDVNGLAAGGRGKSCVAAPGGQMVYQAGEIEDIFPVELDLNQVRHQREYGLNGLGQVLKSFRDRKVEFEIYDREKNGNGYLDTLGPLTLRQKAR